MNRVSVLDRKVMRNLWSMRGQIGAIVLIMLSGVATFVMSLSTIDSLEQTRREYYRQYRFGDVWAGATRAPNTLVDQIRTLPGTGLVESRIMSLVNMTVPGFDDPVTGQIVSVPDDGMPVLNQLHMLDGRTVAPDATDEVVISDQFAEAQDLHPGDSVSAIINGRLQKLTIVGIAMSPEFVYQIKPGTLFPAPERFAIMWMRREPLAAAMDMTGAFNSLTLRLAPGASAQSVIDRLDELLSPFGSQGAYDRSEQPSNLFLEEELKQLRNTATIMPGIFLAVAAFLLNIVVSRLITTQRTQVALLKAFGYTNTDIGVHYLKLVMVVVALGSVAGSLLGVWAGLELGDLYLDFYRFPYLDYTLHPSVLLISLGVAVGAALLGTTFAIYRAVSLPPAVAMRPEPPAVYRQSFIERLGPRLHFSQPSRMIFRQIQRRPVKALLTTVGVAAATAILVIGQFSIDSIDYIVYTQFSVAQREDMTVTFADAADYRARFEVQSMRGVTVSEPFRAVPVRLRSEHRSYRTSIQGFPEHPYLHRLVGKNERVIDIPSQGLLLTDHLGGILGVTPGDMVTVEVLSGHRPVLDVPVSGFAEEYLGVSAYMRLDNLNRLMFEGHQVSGLFLSTDPERRSEILNTLNERPRVAGVTAQKEAMQAFLDSSGDMILTFTYIITLLAGLIAFGVIYNSARISLSERSRDLASLRVLGFTRGEIGAILLGELGLLTLIAIPVGILAGWLSQEAIAQGMQTDLYRIPVYISKTTIALAGTTILAAALISGLVIWRRLNRLDLIEVLKTRE